MTTPAPGIPVTPDKLSDLMDFDHVIQVHPDGTVTEPDDVYAPELDGGTVQMGYGKWSLLAGYTGQYSYNGPIMHSSEFIGGRLARDILDTPGMYVAVVVWADDPNDEPAGWAVAFRETDNPLCGWYALCLNYAIGTAEHVILGPVPICRRCAEKHDLTVTTY